MSKKNKKPRICTIDLETDPFRFNRLPKPFAAGIFDGEKCSIFWGNACIIDLVEKCIQDAAKDNRKRIYYAHNGGKFDLHFLLPSLINKFGHDGIEVLSIKPRMVQLIVKDVCEFRDSFAIIPKPLKSFSNKLDISIWKLEDKVEDLNIEELLVYASDHYKQGKNFLCISPRLFYRLEITKYLRRDCTALHAAVDDFISLYGNNMTLASAAFEIMKKKFDMPAIKTDENFDDKFRQFYFAGRVQFFGLGKFEGDYKICDINSAFPRAMMEKHFFSSSYVRLSFPPKRHRENCFYRVVCTSNGALPKRSVDGGVDFPKGRHEFFASGWELFAGVECGLVSKIEYLEILFPTELLDFSGYITHFYKLKKDAPNESERNFAKLFLNSAYGRFALNPREFRDTKIMPFGQFPDEEKLVKGKKVKIAWSHSYDDEARGLSFFQKPSNTGEVPMRFFNVATAASVTGYVRAFLMRSMHACKGVIYCDTDSIIATDTSALKMGFEIGEWKLEKECDEVHIAGKKLYCARDKDHVNLPFKRAYKTASKGVRLSPEQIIKVALGEQQEFSFEAPNYSVFSKQRFTTRRVNRDDLRKRQ